jgi:excinuclease UvrABC nuclease subunit
MYNGEIIGHPFNLSQTIDTLGKDIIPNVMGIYHLFYKDMLVYIGMSKNLRGRLMQHLKDESKVFQNVLWFSCEDKTIDQVLNIEYNMIKKFKPSLNLTHANAR